MSQQTIVKKECFMCHKDIYTKWEKDSEGKFKFFDDEVLTKPHKDEKKAFKPASYWIEIDDIAYLPVAEPTRIQNLLKMGYKLFGKTAREAHLGDFDADKAIAVLIKPKYGSASQSGAGQPAQQGPAAKV